MNPYRLLDLFALACWCFWGVWSFRLMVEEPRPGRRVFYGAICVIALVVSFALVSILIGGL